MTEESQFHKEKYDYSVAKLRALVYIDSILRVMEIEDKHERYLKIQQIIERACYEAYAFGVDAGFQEMTDKILNINLTTERLYQHGLLDDGAKFMREIADDL